MVMLKNEKNGLCDGIGIKCISKTIVLFLKVFINYIVKYWKYLLQIQI